MPFGEATKGTLIRLITTHSTTQQTDIRVTTSAGNLKILTTVIEVKMYKIVIVCAVVVMSIAMVNTAPNLSLNVIPADVIPYQSLAGENYGRYPGGLSAANGNGNGNGNANDNKNKNQNSNQNKNQNNNKNNNLNTNTNTNTNNNQNGNSNGNGPNGKRP